MSDNIKQNRDAIKILTDQMIYQLKNNSWIPNGRSSFSNKNFRFYETANGWEVVVVYSEYNSSESYSVEEFISPIQFWFLRTFYVSKTLRNYKKFQKEADLAKVSQKFFEKNKDLLRDSKLDRILN
jgi:hypothetical protein